MSTTLKYRIYCNTEDQWKYTWGTSPPTTCPTNATHTVNPNSVNDLGPADINYLLYGAIAGNVITFNSNITTIYGDVGSYLPLAGTGKLVLAGLNGDGGGTVTDIDTTPVTADAQTAYTNFTAMTPTFTSGASNIGGMTFVPGVIALTNAGGVTIGGSVPNNRIILNGAGQYIFQVTNGGLTTDTTSNRVFIDCVNGAKASQVYWAVNGNVNLQTISGNITIFQGTIISQGNITLGTNSNNNGTLAAPTASGSITFNDNTVSSQVVAFSREINVSGYVTIESSLADNNAIQILASDTFGGIFVSAGIGGILVNTTNAIGFNASAQSNFTTSAGNLILQATSGLVNIFAPNTGTGGINIGTDTTPVINIGNTNGATALNLRSASGGISLTASGGNVSISGGKITETATTSASDSIKFDASASGCGVTTLTGSGGYTLNSGTGQVQLVSNNTNVDAIRLDTSGSTGGIFLSAGSSGISIGNDGIAHPIVIGNTTGTSSITMQSGTGTINIGNDGIAKIINIGNTTGTTNVNIDSGTWGIAIGNNSANGGVIQLGNTSVGKDILAGNSNTGGKIRLRWGGSGGFYSIHQEAETVLADSDATLTMDNNSATGILPAILYGTPTANRTLTLPTANDAVAGASGVAVGDSIDFCIINNSTAANNASLILSMGTGGTMIGRATVDAYSNNSGTYFTSGSGLFRLRFTSVTGTTSYTVYRIS